MSHSWELSLSKLSSRTYNPRESTRAGKASDLSVEVLVAFHDRKVALEQVPGPSPDVQSSTDGTVNLSLSGGRRALAGDPSLALLLLSNVASVLPYRPTDGQGGMPRRPSDPVGDAGDGVGDPVGFQLGRRQPEPAKACLFGMGSPLICGD